MQVESPKDLINAHVNQVCWLNKRLQQLKSEGASETDLPFTTVQNELARVERSLEKTRELFKAPKGRLVQVMKSKVFGLRNKVGRVTYVNLDRGYATVSFDGGLASHALSLKNLEIVNMPTPSDRIPVAGMVVKFKDDLEEYVAINWSEDGLYVEPMWSVNSGKDNWDRNYNRKWKLRVDIETINGIAPV
jgi:hypothetical protein